MCSARGRHRPRIPGHHGHHGFGAGADVALEVQHVEVVGALVIAVSTVVAPDLLVTAGAERLLAKAGEDDGAYPIVVAGIGQGPAASLSRCGGGRRCAPGDG